MGCALLRPPAREESRAEPFRRVVLASEGRGEHPHAPLLSTGVADVVAAAEAAAFHAFFVPFGVDGYSDARVAPAVVPWPGRAPSPAAPSSVSSGYGYCRTNQSKCPSSRKNSPVDE